MLESETRSQLQCGFGSQITGCASSWGARVWGARVWGARVWGQGRDNLAITLPSRPPLWRVSTPQTYSHVITVDTPHRVGHDEEGGQMKHSNINPAPVLGLNLWFIHSLQQAHLKGLSKLKYTHSLFIFNWGKSPVI